MGYFGLTKTLCGGLALLLLAMLAGVLFGSSAQGWLESWHAVWSGPFAPALETGIVWNVRLPRVVVVALVGAALAISGASLQALFRNPMADSSVLGISSGGAFAAVLVLFHLPYAPLWVLPAAAFAGGFGTALLLVVLSRLGGRPTLTLTLLTGVVLSSLFSSGTAFALLVSNEYQLRQLIFWLSGGAEARSWSHVLMAIGPITLGGLLLWSRARWLDAMHLGEDHASSVGVPVEAARLWILAGTALSTGAAVSVCGPVGFVGLVIPHLMRPLVGAASRAILPASAVAGALLLVVADLATRTLLPAGMQLGVLTSLLGAPFFLWLLVRARRGIL